MMTLKMYIRSVCVSRTGHPSIPVGELHLVCVGPHESIDVPLVCKAQPEVFLGSLPHQAHQEGVVHPADTGASSGTLRSTNLNGVRNGADVLTRLKRQRGRSWSSCSPPSLHRRSSFQFLRSSNRSRAFSIPETQVIIEPKSFNERW